MAVDTQEKRLSVAALGQTFTAQLVTPNASQDQEWRQASGWLYTGIEVTIADEPPVDDDADTTVTARLDKDGATLRPPRVTVFHSVGSMRNSALVGPDRLPMDEQEGYSIRAGRLPTTDRILRILATASRAGDTFAPRYLEIEYETLPAEPHAQAADTTSGTDLDGAHVAVPQITTHFAYDSIRNADLQVGATPHQDARHAVYHPPAGGRRGRDLRVMMCQHGRAGDAFAVRFIEIEYEIVGPRMIREPKT